MEMTMKAKVDSSGKLKAFFSVALAEFSDLFSYFLLSKFLLLFSKVSLFLGALLKHWQDFLDVRLDYFIHSEDFINLSYSH